MNPPIVRRISECFIKPKHTLEEHKQPWYLAPWDLCHLSLQSPQNGLLFAKTPSGDNQEDFNIITLLEKLKHALSLTLVHFYPLSGRLATIKNIDSASCVVYVDCNNSPGAGFIHAEADLTLSDILSPTYVPPVVQSFFDHDRAINHDGHTMPLLTIQVTELVDGVVIGCSMNHCVADGTSYWHFFRTLSEFFLAQDEHISISIPPIMNRWFPDGHGPIISLPFTHPDQFVDHKFESPLLKDRFFHFSSESIAKIKARANEECNTKITSFKSMCAFIWRCITRARHLPPDQVTSFHSTVNDRSRLIPPLPQYYFGNAFTIQNRPSTTAGELLGNNLGWAAWLLHQAVVDHDDKEIREWYDSWIKSPSIFKHDELLTEPIVLMSSSPKFDKYGVEFGMGKAIAIRSGILNNKFCGQVFASAGREGDGSVDLEISLYPDEMRALESDNEFMDAVTL